MRRLRRRLLAKAYGYKYKRFSDGYWLLTQLDNSHGSSSPVPIGEREFVEKLKFYKRMNQRLASKQSESSLTLEMEVGEDGTENP